MQRLLLERPPLTTQRIIGRRLASRGTPLIVDNVQELLLSLLVVHASKHVHTVLVLLLFLLSLHRRLGTLPAYGLLFLGLALDHNCIILVRLLLHLLGIVVFAAFSRSFHLIENHLLHQLLLRLLLVFNLLFHFQLIQYLRYRAALLLDFAPNLYIPRLLQLHFLLQLATLSCQLLTCLLKFLALGLHFGRQVERRVTIHRALRFQLLAHPLHLLLNLQNLAGESLDLLIVLIGILLALGFPVLVLLALRVFKHFSEGIQPLLKRLKLILFVDYLFKLFL